MPRAFISIGVIQVLIMLVGLVRMKSLSLLLGPGGVGVVGTLDQAIVMLGQASAFGLPFTAMKFMARGHSDGPVAYQRAYAGFLRLLLIASLGVTVLLGLGIRVLPQLMPAGLVEYRAATLLAMAGAPVFVLSIFFVQALASAGEAGAAARLNLVLALSLAVPAVAGAWWGGVTGLYGASLAAGIIGTLAVIAWFSRARELSPALPAGDTLQQVRQSPEIVSYALMAYVTLVVFTATMFATRYVALAELGAADAGRLQAQLGIALAVGAVLTPLTNLYLTPLLNRHAPADDKHAAAGRFARMVVLLFTAGALPVILFPSLVLRVLYSREFTSAAAPLVAFVVWQLLFQVVAVYQQLLLGLDDVATGTFASVAGYLITIACSTALTRLWGSTGVALALGSGALATGTLFQLRLAQRHHHAVPISVIARVVLAMAMLTAGGIVVQRSGEFTPQGLLLRVGVAVLVAGATWLGMHAEDRATVASLVPLLRPRHRS